MAMTPRLELRQGQSLVMTPQLQQAIKLLQLSNLELADFVAAELERNPLLERDESDIDTRPVDGSEAPSPAAPAVERDLVASLGDGGAVPGSDHEALDMDYDNVWNNDSPAEEGPGGFAANSFAGARGGGHDFNGGEGADFEHTLSQSLTLRDHLLAQMAVDLHDPVDRVIAVHLLDMLDDAGYIGADLSPVAERLACPVALVEATLAALQQLDPPGIFARNLAECLALQLKDRNRYDPAMQAMLDNLDLLARRDFAGLARRCGVDAEDLAEMVAEVRALDPKPALAFDHAVAQPITPDILMRTRAGGWSVELNNDTLPRVLVNNRYYAEISRAARSRTDKQYVSEQLQAASWLVKSLHQRATTILKVATEIIRQQQEFFARGVRHLRPLVLRDIAVAIDMHESTVSRVTSNKYMQTPRGIYELKYFFTAAIGSSTGGADHSAESVRHRIKALILGEEPESVLSDDRIVETLRADNIDIARRTVAKYREAMGIPSSVQRRREKMGVR